VPPAAFDIENLARIVGVAWDIEIVSGGPAGCFCHFVAEVLLVDVRRDFPWSLLDLNGWASRSRRRLSTSKGDGRRRAGTKM
jgi:hypothetical protein